MTRAGLAVVAGLTALAGGCALAPVWSGRDLSRTHRFAAFADGSERWLERDGKADPKGSALQLQELVASDDGTHWAYPLQTADGWTLIRNGTPGATWDAIEVTRMSPDGRRVAYLAREGEAVRAVIDDTPGPLVAAAPAPSITLSRAGRVAVLGTRGATTTLFVDGAEVVTAKTISHFGFDATGTYYAAVFDDGEGPRLCLDGALLEVRVQQVHQLAVGARQVAAVVGVAGQQQVQFADQVGRVVAEVTELAWDRAGEHVAWIERLGHQFRVVVDNKPGPWARAIVPDTLRLLPGGIAVYGAETFGGTVAFRDHAPGPIYEAVSRVTLSADGRRWGYVAEKDGQRLVVVDGVERAAFDRVVDYVLGPTDASDVFVGVVGRSHRAVVDGRVFDLPPSIPNTLVVSADGAHWAVAVGQPASNDVTVLVDGVHALPLDAGEVADERHTSFAPHSWRARELRGWVAAKLRQAIPFLDE